MGVPPNGGFIRENPMKQDDLEVPPFMEPHIVSCVFNTLNVLVAVCGTWCILVPTGNLVRIGLLGNVQQRYSCFQGSARSHQGIAWASREQKSGVDWDVWWWSGRIKRHQATPIPLLESPMKHRDTERERERWILRRMIALLDNWRKPVYLTRRSDERWWEVENFGVVMFDLTSCSCYSFKILRSTPGFGPSLSSTLPSPIRSRQGPDSEQFRGDPVQIFGIKHLSKSSKTELKMELL